MDVVKELNHQGMIIDLSHCAAKTSEDAIEASALPCIYSHAACLSLCSSPRNKSDEQLRHIASKGGMIGLVTYPTFIKDTAPTFEDWFAHLEHLVEVVGVDHVGIGTDFIEGQPEGFADRAYFRRPHPPGLVPPGWPWPYPTGVEGVDCYPTMTAGLLERGFDAGDVRKIMGENWLRLFRQCWEHPTPTGASWRPGIPSPTEAGLYEEGEHE
jgi:membrane dipeptidase